MTPLIAAAGTIIFSYVVMIVLGIFWIVVAWRAMRAHERLADATEFLARNLKRNE